MVSNWNVLLEHMDDGSTVATVLEFKDIQTRDQTKEGAIQKVQNLLKQRLAKTEIIQIEVTTEENPLMKFAGIFEGDSDFEEIMATIQAQRQNK